MIVPWYFLKISFFLQFLWKNLPFKWKSESMRIYNLKNIFDRYIDWAWVFHLLTINFEFLENFVLLTQMLKITKALKAFKLLVKTMCKNIETLWAASRCLQTRWGISYLPIFKIEVCKNLKVSTQKIKKKQHNFWFWKKMWQKMTFIKINRFLFKKSDFRHFKKLVLKKYAS